MNMGNKGMRAKDINWNKEVEEYKTQYDDEDGIGEYIENLTPHYYEDIKNTFNSMTELITADDVAVPIWQVLQKHIFYDYMESFMEAWSISKYEEE